MPGKIVSFTDGSRLNMKEITEDNSILEIKDVSLDDIVMTYDETFQMNCFGLDGNNKRVITSMDTLRRSINLYGQVVPIIVSVIDEDAIEPQYQIIDGLKRFYVAITDKQTKIRAIVIKKEIKSAKSIIRLLSNQKVVDSPESIIDEARTVRSQTDDIRESFIEQIYGLDFGSLEYLNNALLNSQEDAKTRRLVDKYRNGELTVGSLVKKLNMLYGESVKYDTHKLSNRIRDLAKDIDDDPERIKAIEERLDPEKQFNDQGVDKFDHRLKMNRKNSSSDENERTVADAESLLRAKQNKNVELIKSPEVDMSAKNLKEKDDERQFVGERHPLPKATRLAILDRDDYTCQVCGAGGRTQPALVSQFQIHHMVDVQLGGNDDQDNLILLCEQCHALITKHKSFAQKPIPDWAPQYDPTTEELDDNPDMWTIMVLSKIENTAYRSTINQISNCDSDIGRKVKHRNITVGQAIKRLRNKLVIKHNFSPYKLFQIGVINLYQEKASLGYRIPNQKIREKAIEKYQKAHKS